MKHEASTQLPTEFGILTVKIFRNNKGEEIPAIISDDIENQEDVPARIHSACFTAETLGSLKCDCKQQLDYAMQYIAQRSGIIIYLPQEGRGIGLSNKIRAYALQEAGYDTIEANRLLGLPIDARTYEDAHQILQILNIKSVKLLTNNPEKIESLNHLGIKVTGRIPVPVEANAHSSSYLQTKQKHMGHFIVKNNAMNKNHNNTSVKNNNELCNSKI